MRKFALVAAGLAAVLSTGSVAAVHEGKIPNNVHLHPSYPCVSFQLDTVTTSNPALAQGNPWFSLPKDHPHFAELFVLLVTAKAGKLPLRVDTTGTASCSNASVSIIYLR